MRFFLVCLIGISMTLSPLFAQTTENYETAISEIKLELLNCKELWNLQTEQIQSLEQNLILAQESQRILENRINFLESNSENLEKLQWLSEQKINDLEASLVSAREKQRLLEEYISSLETQSIALLKSSKDLGDQLLENEEKHVADIEKLSIGYERQILFQRITIIALVAVLIAETVWHMVQGK